MHLVKLTQQLLDGLRVNRPWRPGQIRGGNGQLPKRIKRAKSASGAGVGERSGASRASDTRSMQYMSESINAHHPRRKQMWEKIPNFGYFMSSFRMSDVTASYIVSAFEYEIERLKDIGIATGPNELPEELDRHRRLNIDMMRSVAHQAPKGFHPNSLLYLDMENLPSLVESAGLRLPACATLGHYVGRAAVESVHLSSSFISEPRYRYAHLVHTLQKLLHPHKGEWLRRARDMTYQHPDLNDMEAHIHFVKHDASNRYGFLITESAVRSTPSRHRR
jgi:hypothetical protein